MKRAFAMSFIIVVALSVLATGDAGGQGLSPALQPPGWPEGGTTEGAQQAAPGGYQNLPLAAQTPDAVPATGPVPYGAGWTVPGPGGRTENAGPPGSANDFPAASGEGFPGTTSSGAFPGGSMSTATSGSAGAGTGTGSTFGGSGTGSFGAATPGTDTGAAR